MNYKQLNDEMEVAAIWVNGGIIIQSEGKTKRKVRISEGDLIPVFDGELVRGRFMQPTHKVIGCFGNATSTKLSFMAVDILTQEVEIIKVK